MLVACGVKADEPTLSPTPDHRAMAEAQVSQIMASRRAARTPALTPVAITTVQPTIPIEIEAILAQSALSSEPPKKTPISLQSPVNQASKIHHHRHDPRVPVRPISQRLSDFDSMPIS